MSTAPVAFQAGVRSYLDVLRGPMAATGLMPTLSVPLPADTMLLSTVHPSAETACHVSKSEDGLLSLAAQEVALDRSSTHPLALIVPGMMLQLHCAAPPESDRQGYSHLLTCSVPLAACFKDLLTQNVHSQQRLTCEDGMQYQLDITADTRGLAMTAVQQAAADLERGLDVLLHHSSAVAKSLGLPALKTVDELVSEVTAHKARRAEAVATVLKALSAGSQASNMLDLQYGRALGMRVDQQQCRALREGSVLGNGFSQTLLHCSIAQMALISKIAQEAGVSTHDPLLTQRAVENFVNTHGAQALAHGFLDQAQTVYCSRTGYQFDPTFAPSMKIARAMQNSDGSVTLNVTPQLALQATPGEDQNLTPGLHYADVLGFSKTSGLMRRDCEDGAHALNACGDLLRCVPLDQLLAAQSQLLPMLPTDMQQIGNTLLYVSSQLHANSAPATTTLPQTPLANVNINLLATKVEQKPAIAQKLFATSLLAAAPQLSTSLAAVNNDPSAKLDCTAKEYYAWWTSALMRGDNAEGLTGHAVAISLGLAPLVSTSVDGTRVDIHLLDPNMRVFESTAPARQILQADTAAVKLNLNKAPVTPVRRNLQQQLDQCPPLTMCMACNLRSTLHAAETKNIISQALNSEMLLTGGAMRTGAGQATSTPSIVPMQTFTLRAEAETQQELARQMTYTFYKTLLSCGDGLVFTLDMKEAAAFAGMPMSRQLQHTPAVVVGSPLDDAELQYLRVLGALQSSFVLPAADALAALPPLMPLAAQQRMKFCPVRQQLVPLTSGELAQATHACGMLAQTAMIDVTSGRAAVSPESVVANMHAIYQTAQQVVGPELHVTGGPFADSLLLTFA